MKTLLVDIYKTKHLNSGLGQFSYNFACELVKKTSKEFQIKFLYPPNFKSFIPNADFIQTSWRIRYLPNLNTDFNVWHSLHQFPSHHPGKGIKRILTIHDLNFIFDKSKFKSAKYLKKLQYNINKADVLIAISAYTQKLITKYLDTGKKPIYKIYNGVKLDSYKNLSRPSFVKDSPFFFSIGIISEKKNFHVLIPLMKFFKDHQLIIAGNKNSSYAKQMMDLISSEGLGDRIILTGEISDQEKYWFYSNCEALLFPSLAEGFGLPVIEAMLVGKPVFLSKYTSLPEIGGDLAFYWETLNPDSMKNVLAEGLKFFDQNKSELSKQIINYARKFSWEKCINQYYEVYKEV